MIILKEKKKVKEAVPANYSEFLQCAERARRVSIYNLSYGQAQYVLRDAPCRVEDKGLYLYWVTDFGNIGFWFTNARLTPINPERNKWQVQLGNSKHGSFQFWFS
jgi:hypothetical protein